MIEKLKYKSGFFKDITLKKINEIIEALNNEASAPSQRETVNAYGKAIARHEQTLKDIDVAIGVLGKKNKRSIFS